MREIEFRAKGLYKDTWYYGNFVECKRNLTCEIVDLDENEMNLSHYVRRETLGQYTGFKDKNGKKIFEGDIVSANYYPFIDEGKQNYVGIIEYVDNLCSFQYILHCVNNEKRGISNGINEGLEANEDLILEDFEVIGNVFDNPELVKGENNEKS